MDSTAPKLAPPFLNHIHVGDCLALMKEWPDSFVQCVVTSPPYWGLRDYGVAGQMGLESTPETYVAGMVEVFRDVRRVLREDGVAWVNLGDSYVGNASPGGEQTRTCDNQPNAREKIALTKMGIGLKPKDLVGIPWRIAFALQADGWYLRSDIIWSKPNPMPESVTDRPTKAHEYLFLLTKNERYFYNAEAIKERAIYFDDDRSARAKEDHKSMPTAEKNGIRPVYKDARSYDGKNTDKQRGHGRRYAGFNDRWDAMERAEQCSAMRNKRSVWTIATTPYPEAHFATFPQTLVEPCILAGSRPGDIVLDPFMGAGTVALVASRYNRNFIGCELNPAYAAMAEKRIASEKSQLKMF